MTSHAESCAGSPNRRSITIATEIILLDIRGYSKKSSTDQLVIVEALTDRLRQMVAVLVATGRVHVPELATDPLIIGYIPTGDGAYLILNPLYGGYGVLLALAMRNDLALVNKKLGGRLYDGARVATHLGTCLPYVDITDRVNFAGEGLNDCSRILQARSEPRFPMGFTDEDFVVASCGALACFDELYYSRTNEAQRRLMQCRRSEPFAVEDKHGCTQPVQLVEMHRNIALQPFKPVVNLSGEKRRLMREIAANRLPELHAAGSHAEEVIGEAIADDQAQTPRAREGE